MEEDKIQQLIHTIREKYNYDFSQYHQNYLEQEVNKFLKRKKNLDISKIPIDQELAESLLNHSSLFFRNTDVFLGIKNKIFPYLQSLNKIKIWHAGCGRAEEVYSLAILLTENNLLYKTKIYASDVSKQVLAIAQKRTYIQRLAQFNERTYRAAGGQETCEQYIEWSENGYVCLKDFVDIHFVQQDLSEAAMIDKFDLILCRNLLIYLKKTSYQKALELLEKSLRNQGFLCLGVVETILPYSSKSLKIFDIKTNLYQKII